MLTISAQQMDKFSDAAVKNFENRMLAFLQTNFPSQSRSVGEPGVRVLVRHGMDRARSYGIDFIEVKNYLVEPCALTVAGEKCLVAQPSANRQLIFARDQVQAWLTVFLTKGLAKASTGS
jgi:hypothetical protein